MRRWCQWHTWRANSNSSGWRWTRPFPPRWAIAIPSREWRCGARTHLRRTYLRELTCCPANDQPTSKLIDIPLTRHKIRSQGRHQSGMGTWQQKHTGMMNPNPRRMSYHLHAPLKIFAPAMDVPSSRPSPIMPNPFIIRPSIYPYICPLYIGPCMHPGCVTFIPHPYFMYEYPPLIWDDLTLSTPNSNWNW